MELGGVSPDFRVRDLIEAYRIHGHLAAVTNPVTLQPLEDKEFCDESESFDEELTFLIAQMLSNSSTNN